MSRVTQAHVDARTDSILHAAIDSFVKKGVEVSTMQDIATHAGMSAGAIYRYFPGKTEVLKGVLDQFHEGSRELFAAAREGASSPREAIERAAYLALEEDGNKAGSALWMEMALASQRYGLAKERSECWVYVVDHLEQLIREAQGVREIDPEADARGLALLFLATVKGMMALTLELNGAADQALFRKMIKEVMDRFAPR
ncbi:MAG: TetR/AcrR family transcriptional regulator [Dehalococcoidia bacterium]